MARTHTNPRKGKRTAEPATVGAFAAKTHLARLLVRVAGGETITITRHGAPVARLVPVTPPRPASADLLARMQALAERYTLGDVDWQTLRDEGRK